jgi:hypothetical protein
LTKITFDRVFKAKDRAVSGLKIIAYNNPAAFSVVNTDLKNGDKINEFHKMWGRCGSERLENSTIHDFRLIEECKTCEECAISKARLKNVEKEWKGASQIPREIHYIDISSVKNEIHCGSKIWVFIIENHTDYSWRLFLKLKADLKGKMLTLLSDLNIAGIEVIYICWDNSGQLLRHVLL